MTPQSKKPSRAVSSRRSRAVRPSRAVSSRPIRKVLIANRSEIAIRVCRTLREMGIRSVAIYSEADQDAPHVFAADEALPVGPAPAAQSYLHAERILEAARAAGADAIHPGYGFLSESAAFAEQVEKAGLIWIGPSPSAIRALGDKLSARALALRAGVPVLPGTETPLSDASELRKAADRIGYPVALKAAAGGGGKGLRRVTSAEELEQALRLTQGEARNAFGDDRIYLERWLERPRHIEVQLLGDARGTVIALGERDCSIQRRHQKLVEETPSPALDDARRKELWAHAVKVARAGGYTNAGTAEFLMDRSGKFYFLEVNARLQVEHPVTEMALGLDLVREQIRLAQGEPLSMAQHEVLPRGASIEFRIYAEDPEGGFLPQAGTVRRLSLPQGPGVRCDVGIRSGGQVPIHYDPLMGKIIVWGDSRESALARAARALDECVLSGIPNTLRFHRWLLEQKAFLSGAYDTAFVAQEYKGQGPSESPQEHEDAAILAALHLHNASRGPLFSDSGDPARNGDVEPSRWRLAQTGLRAPWRPR
jgi:acetyl-CoA carboxylase biotin carboxylase subunit